MVRTRSSTNPTTASNTGSKRSAESPPLPEAQNGRPTKATKQQSGKSNEVDHEPVTSSTNDVKSDVKNKENKDTGGKTNGGEKENVLEGQKSAKSNSIGEIEQANKVDKSPEAPISNGFKAEPTEDGMSVKYDEETKPQHIKDPNSGSSGAKDRPHDIPSSILEKGIIYLFFRPRVNVEEPGGIEDVARLHIVLRPLPIGVNMGDLQDDGKARIIMLPKKVLPTSGRDRYLAFVEKGGATVKDVRGGFSGGEHDTKTRGVSITPAATPFAEGIYAITSTPRRSHLAYQITVPQPLGDVQGTFGLQDKGSFIMQVKNPQAPAPGYASVRNPAQYPEELQKRFRDLRFIPAEPEHLDYVHTQLLLIGEGIGQFGKAVEEQGVDKEDPAKKHPEEEMDVWEDEDQQRVEGLKTDDPIFADLDLSAKEYPHLQSTW